jgi:hypothetical protein
VKKIVITLFVLLIGAAGIFLYSASGGFGDELQAPSGPAYVKQVPDDWLAYQQARQELREQHIKKYSIAYDRFANFPESETDGTPYIILKLLPILTPEYWGEGDDFLSVMGLFRDERNPDSPMPRGMGFSGLSRADVAGNVDYASFGCGACHIGRVRREDGSFYYLDGGINSEFNVVGFRKRAAQSIEAMAAGEKDSAKRITVITEKIMAALDKAHAENPNFFYKNYSVEGRSFDAAYEQTQIDLFKKSAPALVAQFVNHQTEVYNGWKSYVAKYYPGGETLLLDGLPGTEDAIGFNTIKANANLKKNPLTKLFASLALPPSHGLTDIMVVWEQNTHDPLWNEEKTDLISGGGQWTGHIPLPIYKNIAAQLTIGFENIDVSVSAFAEEILDQMPASVYPFNVDIALAQKGQQLFTQNCADCHQPHNGKVYRNIGTDMGRANVAGVFVTLGAISGFTDVCSPETTVMMYGKPVKPCAQYKGVSLEGKKGLSMTPPKLHNGYNALPLVGLWAQAPYLHNGSVPTLYHLLIPNERPAQFIKSRLDFDTALVGFSWDPNIQTQHNEGYLLDTRLTPALSNKGHDKNIEMNGKNFKLDWSDDKDGAMALIEYLKTL